MSTQKQQLLNSGAEETYQINQGRPDISCPKTYIKSN